MSVLPSPPISPQPTGARVETVARRASPLARAALFTYTVLLVYGSLVPWQRWRSLGVSPFAYLFAPWPAFVTGFDLALNVLAYVPLGLLLVLALYPQRRGISAIVFAAAIGGLVSVLLEGAQNYLPSRIASNLDVLTNTAGAALGAVGGALLAPALIDRDRLQHARWRWFRDDAAPLLLIVALWPLAQIHPGPMLFGNGELNRDLVAAILEFFGRQAPVFDASQFAAAEVLVTTAGMLAAGTAMAAGMNRRAPRLRLLLLLLLSALVTKAITYGHEFGPARAMAWLTPGAISGLAVGVLVVTAAATAATVRAAKLLSASALLVLVFMVNWVPPNPYHAHWLAAWQPGRLRDVAAATYWLAQAWPFAMMTALLWWMRRGRQLHAGRGQ